VNSQRALARRVAPATENETAQEGFFDATHFEKAASEPKSPCQNGHFPSRCLLGWRFDPPKTARRARFNKFGRKAIERPSLPACRARASLRLDTRLHH